MRILVGGASGLIGTALTARLAAGANEVFRLVRRTPGAGEIPWDPAKGELDGKALEGFDAFVNLSGENVAAGLWTPAQKRRIRESRTKATALLASAAMRLTKPPRVFVSASAIGYYGNRGTEELTEKSAGGTGFLADVCREWEEAAVPIQPHARLVVARFSVVLSAKGGALAKMLLPFRYGAGAKIGPGLQIISWISVEDAVRAIEHCLITEGLSGPVNIASPAPVTNKVFTQTLGKVLHRPAFLTIPAPLVRFALGEMAEETLLSSTSALPEKLHSSGFIFVHPGLRDALVAELNP